LSLCYEFEKWIIITFASIAISLTIGLLLINFAHGQEWNTTQQIQKHGLEIYDTNYCQKNLTATAQRVCGKTDLLCQEHKGENEFWDGFCKTFPEELDKIK
jgi:5-bromo-4-chloroindolyl phosphate hydrolysis protein